MQKQQQISTPKSIRSIRKLKKKQPKVIEGSKNILILKGNKTNSNVSSFLSQFHQLKYDSAYYSRHHQIFPFQDFTPLQKFIQITDASLFLFGSSSKKKPGKLIFGRTFDHKLYDMIQLNLLQFVSYKQFKPQILYKEKPILFFQGQQWQSNSQLTHFRQILTDFFNQSQPTKRFHMTNIKLVHSFTTYQNKIYMRTYSVNCLIKKIISITNNDTKLSMQQVGPHATFQIAREINPDQQKFKQAHKIPAVLKKSKKNFQKDSLGNKRGKIFVDHQNLNKLSIRKRKQLKRAHKQQQKIKQQTNNQDQQ